MRQRSWLLAAAVLFALAAAFMLHGQDDAGPTPPEVQVELPRGLRPAERERLQSRRILPVPAPPAGGAPALPPRPRDPVLAALPRGPGKTALVLEANALRHSPFGELLLACLNRRDRQELEALREKTGIDPLADFDRVVVSPEGMMVAGHFAGAHWDALLREGRREAYGQKGLLFGFPARAARLRDGGTREQPTPTLGIWDNQLVVFGDAAHVRQVLDRVEGRAEAGEPVIREDQTYGEIYGVLATEDLLRLAPRVAPGLTEQLQRAGARVELHVDTRSDVGVVARVTGQDASLLADLGKSLGGALALGRLQAQRTGDERLAALLELARVQPQEGAFNLEVALPLSFLQEQLASCREEASDTAP